MEREQHLRDDMLFDFAFEVRVVTSRADQRCGGQPREDILESCPHAGSLHGARPLSPHESANGGSPSIQASIPFFALENGPITGLMAMTMPSRKAVTELQCRQEKRTCGTPITTCSVGMHVRLQIRRWMREAGMRTWMDHVGNVHGRVDGANASAPALLLGSHYDTVLDAGKFDGALGIIVGAHKIQHFPPQLQTEVSISRALAFAHAWARWRGQTCSICQCHDAKRIWWRPQYLAAFNANKH